MNAPHPPADRITERDGEAEAAPDVRPRRSTWPLVAAAAVLAAAVLAVGVTVVLARDHPQPAHRITHGPAIRDATLDLPAWPALATGCATTGAAFHDGAFIGPAWTTRINGTAEADIDQDGLNETIGLFWCTDDRDADLPRMYFRQVVVFHRGVDGQVLTVGSVAHQGALSGDIDAVRSGPGGTVEVHQADFPSCKGCYNPAQQWQWRGYGWDGHVFRQTNGPTRFTPNPLVTDLRLDDGPLRVRRYPDGSRSAELSLAVTNGGPMTAAVASLHVEVDYWAVRIAPAGCSVNAATRSYHTEVDCDLGRFPAGATRKLRFAFSTSIDDDLVGRTFVQAEAISYPSGVGGLKLPDLVPADNLTVIIPGTSRRSGRPAADRLAA